MITHYLQQKCTNIQKKVKLKLSYKIVKIFIKLKLMLPIKKYFIQTSSSKTQP